MELSRSSNIAPDSSPSHHVVPHAVPLYQSSLATQPAFLLNATIHELECYNASLRNPDNGLSLSLSCSTARALDFLFPNASTPPFSPLSDTKSTRARKIIPPTAQGLVSQARVQIAKRTPHEPMPGHHTIMQQTPRCYPSMLSAPQGLDSAGTAREPPPALHPPAPAPPPQG